MSSKKKMIKRARGWLSICDEMYSVDYNWSQHSTPELIGMLHNDTMQNHDPDGHLRLIIKTHIDKRPNILTKEQTKELRRQRAHAQRNR